MKKISSNMTVKASSRIQSAAAKNRDSRSFTTAFYTRAQSASAKGKGGLPSTTPNSSGGGRDNNPPKK